MSGHTIRRRRRAHLVLAAVVSVLAGLAAILRVFPPQHYAFYPRCPFFEATGLLCPGCGTTRALAALAQGNLAAAMHANALAVLLLPLLGLWGLGAYRRALRGASPWRVPTPAAGAGLAVAIAFAITRNLT